MQYVYALSLENAPHLDESAELILDALDYLSNISNFPKNVGTELFQTELQVRTNAVLTAFRENNEQDDVQNENEVEIDVIAAAQKFQELLFQFFPPALIGTSNEAQNIEQRINNGNSTVSNAEMRRMTLYHARLKLEQYLKHKTSKKSNTASIKIASNYIERIEKEYSREALRLSAHTVLYEMVRALHLDAATLLEKIMKQLLETGEYIPTPLPVEIPTITVIAPTNAVPINAKGRANKKLQPQQPPPEEEEEEEVEEESEEESKEAAIVVVAPVTAAPSKRRGRSNKAETQVGADTAAPVVAPVPAAFSVPIVVRTLAAASERLKQSGYDPLADAVAASQSLSKKRKSVQVEEEEEVVVEEEEEELVQEEESEEEAPQREERKQRSPPKKRGRKAAATTATTSSKYDRESEHAEKITFSDQEGAAEESDNDEPVLLPAFTSKKRVLDKTAAAPASPAPKSSTAAASSASGGRLAQMLAPSSDPSQRNRPAVHRHASDRSVRRVPWSTEEIAKLTDGVVEFATERRKWKLILDKVSNKTEKKKKKKKKNKKQVGRTVEMLASKLIDLFLLLRLFVYVYVFIFV
jgi:hypothetical protein